MKHSTYWEHRDELKAALEKSIFSSLSKLGDKAKELDWFAGTSCSHKKKKAA